jgi:non-specific serine/threonine protein kinase
MDATPVPRPDSPPRPRLRWRFADACFDEASLRLTLSGQPIDLERRPLQLLALLLVHAGEIVTKDEILEALWPDREVSEASLTTCMMRLRQALGPTGHSAIRTVHGYGYRFAAPVTVEATTPAPPPAAAITSLAPGNPVPHRPNWVLLHRLGTGGYGDAWLAEQTQSHERRVFKFARDADGIAALKREVALFRLLREGLGPRHDLIRILDWNFEGAPAFIETVWSELGNLAAWADRQGGAATLPMDLRLELAAQIADALAAIHAMSVLHKDLKPANVLMRTDESGRPAIILTDFGSGRALDPTRLDAFGITRPAPDPTRIDSSGATQMYRAPESFDGGAPTPQADIFAAGVILFQLAAGDLRRPLAAGWESLIADPLLREDIAAAAAGDPAQRLSDAAELAHRLRTLPERRAARARAEAEAKDAARTRRALELARARRTPLLALIGVLLVAFAASTSLYVRADRAQAHAEAQAVRADRAQVRAEAQAARAKAVTEFLTDDLFSAANPLLGADPNIPVRSVLGVAAADLERRFPPGSPDRAAIEAAIGGAYAGLADQAHALPLLRAALTTLRTQLGDADPQTQAVRLVIATLAEHRLDSDGMRQAGQDILAAHPADAETELAGRFYVVIGSYSANGNSAACAAELRPVFEAAKRRLGPLHPFTLKVESELAHRLGDGELPVQAVPMAREAVAGTLKVYGPDHLLLQERRFYLASVLVRSGQLEEAIAILTDVRRRVLAITGTETDFSARVINQIGSANLRLNRYPESLQAYHVAYDYSVRSGGESSELALAVLNNIAKATAMSGHPADAIPLAEKAFHLYRAAYGPDGEDVLHAESNLAEDNRLAGNLAASETISRDVVTRARRLFTHGEYYPGLYESVLGEVLAQEHKNEEARSFLTDGLAILMKSVGPTHKHTLHAQTVLASLPAK